MEMEAAEPHPNRDAFENATKAFALLWLAYLAQWGPKARRTRERAEHHQRLHDLMDTMAEIENPFEGSPTWVEFLDHLPGFKSYWSRDGELGMRAHHAE